MLKLINSINNTTYNDNDDGQISPCILVELLGEKN